MKETRGTHSRDVRTGIIETVKASFTQLCGEIFVRRVKTDCNYCQPGRCYRLTEQRVQISPVISTLALCR